MYFPYLRGRQFELLALRELMEGHGIGEKVIPIIEPVKPSATLLSTIATFVENGRPMAVVFNPLVSDFIAELRELKDNNQRVANDLYELLFRDKRVIKSYIMNDGLPDMLKGDAEKGNYLIINSDRDCLEPFLEIYDEGMPRFSLIPDDRAFRRLVPDAKVILEDCFHKCPRNVDYIEKIDEFFSDNHLYYKEEGYLGFSDYSVVGKGFNESGFAPVAVAIHIVYFDKDRTLRVHHFVSDSNVGIEDTAGKFGEALEKLVCWCDENGVERTLGLQGFYDCNKMGKYPGLGVVKKFSIMHHLELVSRFLDRG